MRLLLRRHSRQAKGKGRNSATTRNRGVDPRTEGTEHRRPDWGKSTAPFCTPSSPFVLHCPSLSAMASRVLMFHLLLARLLQSPLALTRSVAPPCTLYVLLPFMMIDYDHDLDYLSGLSCCPVSHTHSLSSGEVKGGLGGEGHSHRLEIPMYLGTQGTAISPCFVPIIIKQLSSREQPLLSHYCCKRRVSPGGRSSDRFSPHSKPYHPWNTSRLGSSPPAYHFSHFFFSA